MIKGVSMAVLPLGGGVAARGRGCPRASTPPGGYHAAVCSWTSAGLIRTEPERIVAPRAGKPIR